MTRTCGVLSSKAGETRRQSLDPPVYGVWGMDQADCDNLGTKLSIGNRNSLDVDLLRAFRLSWTG